MARMTSSAPGRQLTIFYDGTVRVYEGISQEKAQAIMLIASAAAASSFTGTACGPVLRRCVSLRSSSSSIAANRTTPQPQLVALNGDDGNLFCRMQTELPIARRYSLQRFLQRRKDRLVSKAPYAPAKPSDGAEEAPEGTHQIA